MKPSLRSAAPALAALVLAACAALRSSSACARVYGAPLFVGVRAFYRRTDVFEELVYLRLPRGEGEEL
ncbi:hypothetical protein ABZZ79_20205 [Streptomyces sp. NPDC006458]|uniref:hypothetical protein n=1 Tax=Streptomyces sp. NPDC006458 TaxID=3154302 RepID=UPI0033BAC6FF